MTCSPLAISDVGNVIVCTSSTRPTGTQRYTGRTIFETDTGKIRTWNGTNWVGPGFQVLGAKTTAQGSITTVTDITGLTATWTADATRLYRISWKFLVIGTATNDIAAIYLTDAGGTQFDRALVHIPTVVSGSGYVSAHGEHYVTGLSGSVTRKLRLERNVGSGTLTAYASGNEPAWLVVEDIT